MKKVEKEKVMIGKETWQEEASSVKGHEVINKKTARKASSSPYNIHTSERVSALSAAPCAPSPKLGVPQCVLCVPRAQNSSQENWQKAFLKFRRKDHSFRRGSR